MTGLHVPGVNQHPPDVIAQLRKALAAYDRTNRLDLRTLGSLNNTPEANTLASCVQDLLAEIDGEQHAI